MSNPATISQDKVVSIHYTLKNAAGEVLDTSDGSEDPLLYLHGADNIVPGLEKALDGRAVGDRVEVEVAPEEGYGVRQEGATQSVSRDSFPDEIPLGVGMQFGIEGPNGHPIPVWVAEVSDDHVVLDFNHPLAGETLHFDVTVVDIRPAAQVELDHGHPHGPGGHHH